MKNDGGPAFPNFERRPLISGQVPAVDGGMSLRDYFAAAALQGLLMCSGTPGKRDEWPQVSSIDAERAYVWADAMLAERAK